MSFTNHTPNYNLPQYVGTDKPTFLGDFNNAMSTIDTALHNNEQNAGEGLSELQQAQAALTETQETLTEVQTEVANVSGIASTVNQNVQQALSAANDATTAANSATSQIQPAVTAANQASADAQAAQQVANGNVTTLNQLSERVTALENSVVNEITGGISFIVPFGSISAAIDNASIVTINAPSGTKIKSLKFNFTEFKALSGLGATFVVKPNDSAGVTWDYDSYPATGTEIPITLGENTTNVTITMNIPTSGTIQMEGIYTAEFEKTGA